MKQKVYLIPGTMCNERLWSAILPLIEKTVGEYFEFVHVKIPRNKSFQALSIFLNDFFQEDKVTLIGFSLGGYIASHFASSYPHRIAKAMIISNSPCALHHVEEMQRQDIIEFIQRYGYKGMSKARAAQLLDTNRWTDQQLTQLIDILRLMDAELGEVEFKSQMVNTSKRDDLFKQLANSLAPLTFYYSEDDALVNSSWLEKLQQQADNCLMICSNGASHMLPLEKADECSEQVIEWLNPA
ncbi:MAG: alpha/beta hydrolase [Colwellia sp.]|nr:alpha/beta hydrolase [Colwellia sp.]MCW8865533.1 alpha/beta hydrolase [Colwellia sp.]MCW9080166.1 alpha/beta hydrolase [Colwellia sp.]